jgi:hypothetical protein
MTQHDLLNPIRKRQATEEPSPQPRGAAIFIPSLTARSIGLLEKQEQFYTAKRRA